MPAWQTVIASEPALAVELSADQRDRALEAIANFVDLKSPFMLGHSVAVARLAEEAGRRLRLPPDQVLVLRLAGFVHGFGRLGVSNSSREAWSARNPQPCRIRAPAGPTTVENVSSDAAAVTSTAAAASPLAVPIPLSWPWRRGALILAGAAQLITISALTGADPLAVTWSALLLAIAPAPLAAAAAFAPAPVNRVAMVAAMAALIAGIAGVISHTGLFFVPALAVLAIGTAKLWRERS